MEIRCYRTDCKFNRFEKSNCGHCRCGEVVFTKDGCMDYLKGLHKGKT